MITLLVLSNTLAWWWLYKTAKANDGWKGTEWEDILFDSIMGVTWLLYLSCIAMFDIYVISALFLEYLP